MRSAALSLVVAIHALGCASITQAPERALEPGTVFREDSDHGRPRCLVAAGVRSNVFFRWPDADRYARVVQVRRDRRPCHQWRAVLLENDGWTTLAKGATHALARPMSAQLQHELAQVRQGANEIHDAAFTPAQAARGPFTLEANTELTARYGHGFAGQAYAHTIASQPHNAWAFAALEGSMSEQLAAGEAASLALMKERGRNVVVLVSMGYGWDETVDAHTVGYVKDFIETVQSLGVSVDVLERNTHGGLEENAALLVPKVRAHLSAGKDVVLFGLCKGSPELFAATATVLAPYLDTQRTQAQRPAGWGRVAGVLNMSGMMSGVFFGDWLGGYGAAIEVLGAALTLVPWRAVQDQGRYLAILPSITSEKVAAFTQSFAGELPADAVYLDVIGVVSGDGLLEKDLGAMAPLIELDRAYDIARAANDGFIRYPGNELPRGISAQHYAVVMSGSHMLFDGAFGPHSMAFLGNQRALFRSAIQFVLVPPAGAP